MPRFIWRAGALLHFALLTMFVGQADAQSGKRVALVIGNGKYESVTPLVNPRNDANAIADALRRLAFDEVHVALDKNYMGLRQALTDFSNIARQAEMALVFYAGHGIEFDGQNYLIPTDARLARAKDAELELITMRQVQSIVEDASGVGIVILDACRNNPFIARMIDPRGAARTISRGLTRPLTRGNTLVVYSARDGTTADDGKGSNSPFTEALLKYIEAPDLEIGLLFRQVRDDVISTTGPNDPQEPFTYGSLSAKPIFLRKAPSITVSRRQLEIPLGEYRSHFREALLRPEWDQKVEDARVKLVEGRPRYEAVAQKTGVPWFVIGILNILEANGKFDSHLHNGDPLTERTRRVPAGRPREGEPPFTWEQSAEDSLRLTKLDKVAVWTLEDTLAIIERYNGFGYRGRVNSPYLWSGSTLYEKGAYVRDGKFDPNAVPSSVGAAVLLKYAIHRQELERTLKYHEGK